LFQRADRFNNLKNYTPDARTIFKKAKMDVKNPVYDQAMFEIRKEAKRCATETKRIDLAQDKLNEQARKDKVISVIKNDHF
jgi:hypothetical protein